MLLVSSNERISTMRVRNLYKSEESFVPVSQTFKKRERERARRERQAEKARKKAERKQEPKGASDSGADAPNPAELFDENGEPRELDFHDF